MPTGAWSSEVRILGQEPSNTPAHKVHDFAAKLRQPAVAPELQAYVAWRRELARHRSLRIQE